MAMLFRGAGATPFSHKEKRPDDITGIAGALSGPYEGESNRLPLVLTESTSADVFPSEQKQSEPHPKGSFLVPYGDTFLSCPLQSAHRPTKSTGIVIWIRFARPKRQRAK
jgi:hypothetical protein